ncbi:DUF1775 domain-containing protein [Streptomyces violascens]|uniref:DUF1775 domain-containing protein n=1 Tax=Streptomyces violascens TaxID=67381 RepID=UPI0036BADED1
MNLAGEAVSQITWTGGTIKPGQYQDFQVTVDQLPHDTDQLTFKALQTYSDGKVVRWIDEARQSQPEPDNPAPVLHLTQAVAPPGSAAPGVSAAPKAPAAVSSSDSTARGPGIAGLVVGVLGLAVAAIVLRDRRAARG